MAEQATGRHRAGGVGRLVAVRTTTPRHALPGTEPLPATARANSADAATMEMRVDRPRRWPWAVVAAALLALGATAPLLLHDPGTPQAAVPLPGISIPAPRLPVVSPSPSAAKRPLRAVAQTRKVRSPTPGPSSSAPPVLLGPAGADGLPQLLNDYCRANVGRTTLAVSTADGWVCGRLARDPVPIDMDAMCRWRYGAAAWADLPGGAGATGWRCYRDGP